MSPRDTVKEILFNDRMKIVYILEELGCYKINPSFAQNEIRCALPYGTNATSISVLLQEYIPVYVFSMPEYDDYERKDIITLVQFIKGYDFFKALEWLCVKLQVEFGDYTPTETMPIVNEIRREKRKKRNDGINTLEHKILPLSELTKYDKCVVEDWTKEGLSPESQTKYGILNDKTKHRWLIPIYDENGNLVSFKGRTYSPSWEQMGISKYIYYEKLGVNDILFGLNFNKEKIKEKDEIILFEAEKSVIAADSYGYDWSANLGKNGINKHLRKKILSLKISNCVLAFDKDVSWADGLKEAKKLSKYMNVYIVFDRQGLLSSKQSPVDKGKNIWEILYRTRQKVR